LGAGFETERDEGVVRVVLSGDLDVSTAPSVEEQLIALEDDQLPPRLVIDLSDLGFIDSTGLSLLINADRRGRKAGRHVTIVSGSGPPRRILETTGLGRRLDIVE
jgi:anti-sigma B factor antagonist